MKKKILLIIMMILVVFTIGTGVYLGDYYRAEEFAWQCITEPSENVNVYEQGAIMSLRQRSLLRE